MKEFTLSRYSTREERDAMIRQMVEHIFAMLAKRKLAEQTAKTEENQLPPDIA